jgi:pyruvate dehydrogenase E1 component
VHGVPMIPFYIFYSMFGFQRIGDLAWAAGDIRARGFLIGATAGRTTLNGEGLQHEDGHSHILAGTVPNCITYDPTFAYEVAVIVHDGLKRMYVDQEDIYYYLTVENENYHHAGMPEGAEEGILKGLYQFSKTSRPGKKHVNLMGCGSIFQQALKAQEMLKEDFGVTADLWSATSFNELARDAQDCERHNRMNPTAKAKVPFITQTLSKAKGPVVVATDYMKNLAEQVRHWVEQPMHILGTDGFGRSDSRVNLRRHFEVDANHIAATAMYALHKEGAVTAAELKKAYAKYEIDPNKPNPRTA